MATVTAWARWMWTWLRLRWRVARAASRMLRTRDDESAARAVGPWLDALDALDAHEQATP